METPEEIVTFTEEELEIVMEVLEAQREWYKVIKNNPREITKTFKKTKKDYKIPEFIEWVDDTILLFTTLMEEPDLLFETKNNFAIATVHNVCENMPVAGKRKEICLSIMAKLAKEHDIVKKIDEAKGITYNG